MENLAELAIHRLALFLELVVVFLYITMFCHLQWELYASSAMDQNVPYERKCSRRHTTRIRLIHAFSEDVRGIISVYYTRRGTVTGKDSDKCKRQFSSIRHSTRNPCREMASMFEISDCVRHPKVAAHCYRRTLSLSRHRGSNWRVGRGRADFDMEGLGRRRWRRGC
jgi:hypothetical protein